MLCQKKLRFLEEAFNNVLLRAIKCCEKFNFNGFARICGDRPFHSFKLLKRLISIHIDGKYDLTTNNQVKSFPKGLTAEIISLESLKKVCNLTNKSFDLEHITHFTFIKTITYLIFIVMNKKKLEKF